ncbi:flagellar hook-associated protein FlgK [Vibrio sp. SM6]|uniref:Flagellar hook-associated protein 1 n=1 Tax=Vibrio agarilyticus TaxID=2726741 RepID=A0A7X8TSD6_9VIBR|nr:flagellar hook-associated protein FlgK [Vibrio agarilyticus]NLS13727.1 flagellar hook-associated protein FlgK [Vibrio agarilyticus]
MSLINIAMSGLNANSVALNVTAQNVANINTPGYSRQQAVMASVAGSVGNSLSAGMGVEVTSIRRITDGFVVKQVWSTNSSAAFASSFHTSMSQLENTLSADGLNLSSGLDSLFAALNEATTKPESQPLRQQVINEAEALARRFNALNDAMHSQHKDMHDQRNASIAHGNSLLSNIADINSQLMAVQGTGGSAAQLLDTRDALIGELAMVVDIRTTEQPDGSLQVTLASGQPLVMGGEAGQLKAVTHSNDAYMADIHVEFGPQSFAVSSNVGGGLGAISQYQTEVLKPNQVAINDMAKGLADEVNAVLATGIDLNGNPGAPLFTYDPSNPANSLTITDVTADDLAFSSDGNEGNSDVLKALIELSNKPMAITGYGNVSLNDAFTSMVGDVAIKSRQAAADFEANSAMNKDAITQRNNLSAVSSDEEAGNLMVFANAHNANMKVISTANELFDSVLQLF